MSWTGRILFLVYLAVAHVVITVTAAAAAEIAHRPTWPWHTAATAALLMAYAALGVYIARLSALDRARDPLVPPAAVAPSSNLRWWVQR